MSEHPDASELSADDCRRIFRLVHELCELGNDPVQWNTHLVQSVGALVDAPVTGACVIASDLDPARWEAILMVKHYIDDAWTQYIDQADVRDNPLTPPIMSRLGTDWTCTRRELADDAAWYGSPFYERVAAAAGTDDNITSHVCVRALRRIHQISVMRRPGEAYFGARETAVIRFLHAELAHLWRKPEAVEIDTLPKRLLETVAGMRRGLSRKEIATDLDISPHTVHTYERQLFDRFAVTSRGELLARLARAIRPSLPK